MPCNHNAIARCTACQLLEAIAERDRLASKLATAVEALRWIHSLSNMEAQDMSHMKCDGPCDSYGICAVCSIRNVYLALEGRARTALAAIERKEGAGE